MPAKGAEHITFQHQVTGDTVYYGSHSLQPQPQRESTLVYILNPQTYYEHSAILCFNFCIG